MLRYSRRLHLGSIQSFAAASADGNSWHEADLQRTRPVGLPTAGLPTFDTECRFTIAFKGLGVADATVA
jgi:hypothetical protein